jgi:hypothetical protein
MGQSQDCGVETANDVAKVARDSLRSQTTGTSETWLDWISRMIAQVDSLDLDSGDTSTDLTWNIDDNWTFKTSVVNEPDLFMPLKEAIGDDSDLLSKLSDRVGQGDDVEFSLDFNLQKKGDQNNKGFGVWGALEGMTQTFRSTSSLVGVRTMSCAAQQALRAEALRVFEASTQEEVNPRTLTANVTYRSRDDLAGPDKVSVSVKYTYGFGDESQKLANTAMSLGLETVEQNFKSEMTSAAAAFVPDKRPAATAQIRSTLAGGTRESGITNRRFSFEGKWTQQDDYSFPLSTGDFTLPEDESITVMMAYSFRFRGDKASDGKNLPLFELNASYEDVDGDSARQSRLIAKATFSRKLAIMGENTELTAGLVWANRPEYLADQDFDRELSANLGLTFKVGTRPPGDS